MADEFDAAELAAAERLDAEIAATRDGRPPARTDPAVLWLAASLRTTPPKRLRQRIAAAVRRPAGSQFLARLAAAVFALTLVAHGLGNQFLSEWVASQLGEPYGPHAYIEGGWALLAVAVAVGAGAVRRRLLPLSVGTGVPLGFLLGAGGIAEIGVFPLGAVLHLAEGLLAAVLFVTWFVAWRYGGRPRAEGRL